MASVSEVLKKARELEKRGDWEAAASEYKQLQSLEHPPPIAFNLLGDLYQKKGETEEAYIWYEKAIETYAGEGLYANAIGICRKALRQDRDRLEVLQQLGGLFHSQGLAREAVNHYLLFASSVAKRGDLEAVVEASVRVREILPDDPAVREKMGQLLHAIGANDEAMLEFEAAASGYNASGDVEEADRILAISKEIAAAAGIEMGQEPVVEDDVFAGESLEMASGIEATIEPLSGIEPSNKPVGEIAIPESITAPHEDTDFVPVSEILREFQEGVERILDENDYQSHYDIGMSYKEMGLFEEALSEFDAALPSADLRTSCMEMRASVLIELGRYEESVRIIEELIEDQSENEAGGYYLMGTAFERQGNAKKALAQYRIVEQLDPHFKNVKERIARVAG